MAQPFDIPGYRIVRRLGQGGMATVYLAVQLSLGRPVAIKVLASERTPSEELVTRFEHEARTIARLDHPHIVAIFDVGRTSTGQLYYTMPYLPNGDLAGRNLRDDEARVLEIMRALAQALAYAHEQGIVHRDVKPENVLFDKMDRPLLADFGIALTTSAEFARVTREGATIGSSGYMSPEQARGQPLDGRSDLYSLGVVCYELLSGEMPYKGPDSLSMALAHVEQPVPRLPPNRRHWQAFVDRAMGKTPEIRYQSADEMLGALDDVELRLGAPPATGLDAIWQRVRDNLHVVPRRTRALAVGLACVAALGILIALLPRGESGLAAMPPDPLPGAAAATNAAATTAATTPTAPVDATPEPPMMSADDLDRLLREGEERTARGRLIAPKGDNAAERYLEILKLYPDQSEAIAGLKRVIEGLGVALEKALVDDDADAARTIIEQSKPLVEAGHLRESSAYAGFVTHAKSAIDQRRAKARASFSRLPIESLAALLPALQTLDPALARSVSDDLDKYKSLSAGSVLRDRNGPALVFVPAVLNVGGVEDRLPAPFALGRTEVTRGEYGAFARATNRAAATCREPLDLFSRFRKLAWNDAGFEQTDEHPVVCVSWDDADAYARWLSQRTGAHYRLPTVAEWRHAARVTPAGGPCTLGNVGDIAFDKKSKFACNDGYARTAPVGRFAASALGLRDLFGNVSEWVDGCADGDAAKCRQRAFRGLSWRDGPGDSNLERHGESAGDTGYTTIGFRVVREISSDNLPDVAAR